jgi:hypothetical protein
MLNRILNVLLAIVLIMVVVAFFAGPALLGHY